MQSERRPRKGRPAARKSKIFYTKVVGVTRTNSDGTSRQEIIANCMIGETAELVPEPDNRHDRNAIAVYVGGEQIGYISAGVAASMAPQVKNNTHEHSAWIADIKGGIQEAPTLGIVLEVHCDARLD